MYKELSSVFKKLKIEYEIIFVNDCSPDQSKELILKISKNDPRVVVVLITQGILALKWLL